MADDSRVTLTGKWDPGTVVADARATLADVERAAGGTATAVATSAEEEAAALAVVQAQYNLVATAAGEAAGAVANASAAETESAAAAYLAAAAAEQEAAARARAARAAAEEAAEEARVAAISDDVAAAQQRAADAVDAFGRSAERGTGRLQRPATAARDAINQLAAAVERARAAGAPVPAGAVEAIEHLNAAYEQNLATAGRVAAVQRQVAEELRAAQGAAGEFQGRFRSLSDIAGLLSPQLGRVTRNVEGLGFGFLIAINTARELINIFKETSHVINEIFTHDLELAVDRSLELDGSERQLASTLKNVLAKEGYDVVGKSLTELKALEEDREKRQQDAKRTSVALRQELVGNAVELLDQTKRIVSELSSQLQDGSRVTGQVVENDLAKVDKLIAEFEKFGREVPPELAAVWLQLSETTAGVAQSELKRIDAQIAAWDVLGTRAPASITHMRDALAAFVAANAGAGDAVRATEAQVLKTFGIRTPEEIQKSVDKLETFASLIESSANTGERAGAQIARSTRALFDAIMELPRAQASATEIQVDSLRELVSEYELAADGPRRMALASRISTEAQKIDLAGLQASMRGAAASTVDAVSRQAASLTELGRNFRAAAGAADDGSRLSVGAMIREVSEIERLREEIRQLPADQQEAAQKSLAALDAVEKKYRENAEVAAAAVGVSTVDSVRRATAELLAYEKAVGGAAAATHEQAEKIKGDALGILERIEELPPAQRKAAAEEAAALAGLDEKYSAVAAHRKSLVLDFEAAEKSALAGVQAIVKAWSSEADSLLAKLKEVESATKSSRETNLGDIQKQIDELRSKPQLSVEETNKLNELTDQLHGAQTAVDDLRTGVGRWHDETADAVVSQEDARKSVLALVDALKQNKEGYQALGESEKAALQNSIQNLQNAGDQGRATAELVRDTFQHVGEVLAQTGADTSELQGKFGALAQDGVGDLRVAFDQLDKKQEDVRANLPGLRGEYEKAAATLGEVGEKGKKAGGEIELSFKGASGQALRFHGAIKDVNQELAVTKRLVDSVGSLLGGNAEG